MLFHPGQLLFFLQKVCHMLMFFSTLQVYTPKLVQCGMACVTQKQGHVCRYEAAVYGKPLSLSRDELKLLFYMKTFGKG